MKTELEELQKSIKDYNRHTTGFLVRTLLAIALASLGFLLFMSDALIIGGILIVVGGISATLFIMFDIDRKDKIKKEIEERYPKLIFKDEITNILTGDIIILEGPITDMGRIVIISINKRASSIRTRSITPEERKKTFLQ